MIFIVCSVNHYENVAGSSLFVRMAPVNVSDDVYFNVNYCKLATRIWSWSLWLTDKHTECWKWNGERESIINVRLVKHWNRIVFLVSFNSLLSNLAAFMLFWKLFLYCLRFLHYFRVSVYSFYCSILFNIYIFSLITGMWNVNFVSV